jgi:K+-transporting ATPase KdpF subunit
LNVDWTQLVASATAAFLGGYLLVALLKPEWFS